MYATLDATSVNRQCIAQRFTRRFGRFAFFEFYAAQYVTPNATPNACSVTHTLALNPLLKIT